jgi:outer membrane protein
MAVMRAQGTVEVDRMNRFVVSYLVALMASGHLCSAQAGISEARSVVMPQIETAKPVRAGKVYVRIGAAGVFYHSGANIKLGGVPFQGATLAASDDVTVTFDIGYDLTKNFSLALMAGVPPRPTGTGEGTASSLGALGASRYGPAILSANYRLPRWGALQPYAGPGIAYAIVIKDHDAAITDLAVRNNFGFVLQGGADYMLSRKWGVFADVKELWLAVNAHGFIEQTVPVTAHVRLNPTLVSAGIKYHF